MGVSVRVSRNVRFYLPFWVAIPAYLLVVTAWAVIVLIIGIPWCVMQIVRGIQGNKTYRG